MAPRWRSPVQTPLVNPERLDIPYFADNQLDPKHFPTGQSLFDESHT